jgi:3-methyl-2-oxobutanoate hydroxymethyltransferase
MAHSHETTLPITLDQMLHHCQAVKRGVDQEKTHTPLLVGDMPFGTYEFRDTDVSLRNAHRFVKEAGMDAVKLEVSIAVVCGVCVCVCVSAYVLST